MVDAWEYYINVISHMGRSTFQDPLQIINLVILGLGGIGYRYRLAGICQP